MIKKYLKLAIVPAVVSLAPLASSTTNVAASSGYHPLFTLLNVQPDCLAIDPNGAVVPNPSAERCDTFGGYFAWTVPAPVTATANFIRNFKVYGKASDHAPPFLPMCSARSLKVNGTTRTVSPSVVLPLSECWITLGGVSVYVSSGDTTDVQCNLFRGSWIRTIQHQ
jgi:hypothetical protein